MKGQARQMFRLQGKVPAGKGVGVVDQVASYCEPTDHLDFGLVYKLS